MIYAHYSRLIEDSRNFERLGGMEKYEKSLSLAIGTFLLSVYQLLFLNQQLPAVRQRVHGNRVPVHEIDLLERKTLGL